MKKVLLFIAIIVLVIVGMFASGTDTNAVPVPTATMTPVYEYWQPGQSGYFLCEGGLQLFGFIGMFISPVLIVLINNVLSLYTSRINQNEETLEPLETIEE